MYRQEDAAKRRAPAVGRWEKDELKTHMVKLIRILGVLLGLYYLYLAYINLAFEQQEQTSAFTTVLTILYGLLLVAPWRVFGRLSAWKLLYSFFTIISIIVILNHLSSLLFTLIHTQITAVTYFVISTIEIAQIPIILRMKRNSQHAPPAGRGEAPRP
jgi:uncharacterized membrane protein